MATMVFNSLFDFVQALKKDPKINGVSRAFAKKNPDFERDNETNKACWNCLDCTDCINCINCTSCKKCIGCIRSKNMTECVQREGKSNETGKAKYD